MSNYICHIKMRLCLDTLIIWNMLSILNELTLQMKLQTFGTINVFWTRKTKHDKNKTENQTNKTYGSLPEPGIEPATFCSPVGCVTTRPSSLMKVLIAF